MNKFEFYDLFDLDRFLRLKSLLNQLILKFISFNLFFMKNYGRSLSSNYQTS